MVDSHLPPRALQPFVASLRSVGCIQQSNSLPHHVRYFTHQPPFSPLLCTVSADTGLPHCYSHHLCYSHYFYPGYDYDTTTILIDTMATGTGLSPYKGILSANLYERLEDELRARPTVLIPPQHNGDASSPSPTSNSTGSATASESGNLHHRASSSRDSPSTPHPNGYLSTIQENGEYDTNTNTSGARGNGNGSARGVEVAEGTRMAASDYLSHGKWSHTSSPMSHDLVTQLRTC